jgi:hypothetical protein
VRYYFITNHKIKNEVFEILKDELRNLKLSLEKDKGKGKGGKGSFV